MKCLNDNYIFFVFCIWCKLTNILLYFFFVYFCILFSKRQMHETNKAERFISSSLHINLCGKNLWHLKYFYCFLYCFIYLICNNFIVKHNDKFYFDWLEHLGLNNDLFTLSSEKMIVLRWAHWIKSGWKWFMGFTRQILFLHQNINDWINVDTWCSCCSSFNWCVF